MSLFALFFIVVIVSVATSEDTEFEQICVPVDFENGLADFNDTIGPCSFVPGQWEVGYYTDVDIESPHVFSSAFIKTNLMSCTSSFDLKLTVQGIVEVTFYMSTQGPSDALHIMVNERQESDEIAQPNHEIYNMLTPGIVRGWNTVRIKVGSVGNFTGFVSIFQLYIR